MRILNCCTNDWANFMHDNARALRAAGVDCIDLKRNPHAFQYPSQSSVVDIAAIYEQARDADVVQVFHSDVAVFQAIRSVARNIVMYHTGSAYRNDPEYMNAMFNPHVVMTFTDQCEFMRLGAKNLHYIAAAVDVDLITPTEITIHDPVRIRHYPSNAEVKGTAKISELIRSFSRALDFVSETATVSWADQVRRYRNTDVYVELFQPELSGKPYGCWGVTAFEASAAACIVMTQFPDESVYRKAYGTNPHIAICNTPEQFHDWLEIFTGNDQETNLRYKQESVRWVMKYHSFEATGKYILKQLHSSNVIHEPITGVE